MDVSGEFMTKSTTRFVIREMLMRNFKGYKKLHIGPFDECFNVLLCPDTSVKVNVIEALLFLFGKEAKKELIYSSTNNKNLESASVCVRFRKINDFEDETSQDVPQAHLNITREVFQDDTSQYYIDQEPYTTSGEVIQKLKEKGLDLDNNRFLVLQGEGGQSSVMKPKNQGLHDEGFLKCLEDIFGISKHIEIIEQLHTQVEGLKQHENKLMTDLVEKERESESLKGAEADVEQEKGVLSDIKSNATRTEEIQKEATELQASVTSRRKRIRENNDDLEKFTNLYNKILKQHEFLDIMNKQHNVEGKKLYEQSMKSQKVLENNIMKIEKMEKYIAENSPKVKVFSMQLEDLKKSTKELEDEFFKLQKSLNIEQKMLEEITESYEGEASKYKDEFAEVLAQLFTRRKELVQQQKKLEDTSAEKKLLLEKIGSNAALSQRSVTMRGGGKRPRVDTDSRESLREAVNAVSEKVKSTRQRIHELEYKSAETQEEIDMLKRLLKDLEKQREDLEEQLHSQNDADKPSEDESAKLELLNDKILKAGLDISKLKEVINQTDQKLKLLKEKEEARCDRLAMQRTKVKQIQNLIDKNQSDTKRHNVMIEGYVKDISRLEEVKKTKEEILAEANHRYRCLAKVDQADDLHDNASKKAEETRDALAYWIDGAKFRLEKLKKAREELGVSQDDAESELVKMKSRIKVIEVEGGEHMKKQAELKYDNKVSTYKMLVERHNSAWKKRLEAQNEYDIQKLNRLQEFTESFATMSPNLRDSCKTILGGDVELKLEDSSNHFSKGVSFKVETPKGSWKSMAELSRSEKIMSLLALGLALHRHKPTPLYVVDEMDSALDSKNVANLRNYVKSDIKDAQIVILSLEHKISELDANIHTVHPNKGDSPSGDGGTKRKSLC